MTQLGGTGLKRLHRGWKRVGGVPLGLVLENVASPWNVGAILRTAAALGVQHLYLAGETAPPRSPKTQKTALGTDRYLTWTTHDGGPSAVRAAQADGLFVVALELTDAGVPLHTLDLDRPVAILVGHEDRGVTATALVASDAIGYLPLIGRVGSLNVATATSIALYEVRRAYWATHGSPAASPAAGSAPGAQPDPGAALGLADLGAVEDR